MLRELAYRECRPVTHRAELYLLRHVTLTNRIYQWCGMFSCVRVLATGCRMIIPYRFDKVDRSRRDPQVAAWESKAALI
jgi:hypothetical protein